VSAAAATRDRHFGGCPVCGSASGYVNVGRDHFMTCHVHRVYSCIGFNLFSSWVDETEEVWETNARLLDSFTEVDAVYDGDNFEALQ